MDAKHKTLTGVVAALFFGAILVPFVTAQDTNPSDAPDVVFSNDLVGGYFKSLPDYKAESPIEYDTPWDVTFTNLTAGGIYSLQPVSGGSRAATATASQHGGNASLYNVTFSSKVIGASAPVGKFDLVGDWELLDPSTARVGLFKVGPAKTLNVALSQGTFAYTTKSIALDITVTNASGGGVKDATVDLSPLGGSATQKTDSSGYTYWSGSAPAAGEYTIKVKKDTGGTSDAELVGEAKVTVTPSALTTTTVNADVFDGFTGPVNYSLALPAGISTPDYRLKVAHPSGCIAWWNGTISSTFAAPTGNVSACDGKDDGELQLRQGASGIRYVEFQVDKWVKSQYTLTIGLNTVGSADVEYQATQSWSPKAPEPVNLETVISGGAGNGKLTIQPLSGVNKGAGTATLPAAHAVTVTVTGSHKNQHPAVNQWNEDWTGQNVTLSGDFLTLYDSAGNQIAPKIDADIQANGQFSITNLYPATGGGEVVVTVNYKNITKSKVLTISAEGGKLEADRDTVTVDTATVVGITLRGSSGALDPYGEVQLYQVVNNSGTPGLAAIDSAPRYLSGNGHDGSGMDGKYVFTLNEDDLGSYMAFGTIGQTNKNYTYTSFRVVAAHDWTTTLVSADSILGSSAADFAVNVTDAEGKGVSSAVDLYVLSPENFEKFQDDGTLPAKTVATWTASTETWNFTHTPAEHGTWHIYAKSTDGRHDNLDAFSAFEVTQANVSFGPGAVADNADIEKDTVVTVTVTDSEGNPLNGTLILDTDRTKGAATIEDGDVQSGTPVRVKVENGEATMNITGSKAGVIHWEFNPSGTPGSQVSGTDVIGSFTIAPPAVTVEPSKIPVGQTTPVTITVKDLSGNTLAGRNVQICGQPIGGGCTGNATTDENGRARVGVTPFATGNLTLRVSGNETTSSIRVFAGLVLSVSPEVPTVGEAALLKVRQPGQEGEAGVDLVVSHQMGNETHVLFQGVTGSLGFVRWTPESAGTFTVTASKAGFEDETVEVTVDEAPEPEPVKAPAFELSDLAVAPSTIELGQETLATVTVSNSGNGDGSATVRLKVNGVTLGTESVALNAGSSDTIGLNFRPTTVGTYEVTVELADGSKAGPVTLTVEKPAEPEPPAPPQQPDNDKDTQDKEKPKGVPGFTAVFSLAALGVAFLLVRRRD